MTEIPETHRISMPAPRSPTEKMLSLIRKGDTLPRPETLLEHPEVVDALLEHIRRSDAKVKMQILPAVEKYLEHLDHSQPDVLSAQLRSRRRKIKRFSTCAHFSPSG